MLVRVDHWALTTAVAFLTAAPLAGVSDAWVTARVKMSLMASPQVGGIPIDVDTNQGLVTLNGKVKTRVEKSAAERIASNSSGVASVRNLLQVVPKRGRKSVHASDERIESLVADALRNEPALSSSGISVKSVNQGVVLLAGRAERFSDHLLAMELANAVPGTRRVASEVMGPNQYGDREVWGDAITNGGGGNRVTDAWITTKTKMSLMTDETVPASDINIDTHRGVVTLFGTVPSTAAKKRAHDIAREISGVRAVDDELRVVERIDRWFRSDRTVEAAVRRRLEDASIQGAKVEVDVKGRTARLTGTVVKPADSYTAVGIAYRTPGVEHVVNDIHIDMREAS